jgi:hypothetical protein
MDVRHDAASLYRFVDSVCSCTQRRGDYPAYLDANRRFIEYISDLGVATKAYLRSFPDKIEGTTASDYNDAGRAYGTCEALGKNYTRG